MRLSSKEILAERLGMDRRHIESKLSLYACALLHCDRAAARRFADAVRRDASDLSMFIEVARYDSTQLSVTTEYLEDVLGGPGSLQLDAQEQVGISAFAPMAPAPRAQPTVVGKSSARCNLMGSQHRFAILAKFPETRSIFHAFVGDNINWVQVTDRGTAAVERRALAEASSVDVSAVEYRFKVRVATSDAASSNISLERKISHERGPGWVTLHLQCSVHKARFTAFPADHDPWRNLKYNTRIPATSCQQNASWADKPSVPSVGIVPCVECVVALVWSMGLVFTGCPPPQTKKKNG